MYKYTSILKKRPIVGVSSLTLSLLMTAVGCGDDGDPSDDADGSEQGGNAGAGRAGAGRGGSATAGRGGSATAGRDGSGGRGELGGSSGDGGTGAIGEDGWAGTPDGNGGDPNAGGVGGDPMGGDAGRGGGAAGSGNGGDGIVNAYAVTENQELVAFDRTDLGEITSKVALTGVAHGEQIVGIDFRPADGALYALGSAGNLYTLNTTSGAATLVAALSAAAGDTSDPYAGLDAGARFAVDFNPAADLLRVVTSTGKNLRIVPSARTINGVAQVAGATFTDGKLNPGAPAVSAAAYDDNFNLTCRTRLLVIDAMTDKLYLQNPPNNGTLVEIGSLGVDATAIDGFDIVTDTDDNGLPDTALAALTVGGATGLYAVNVMTGAAVSLGAFGGALEEVQLTGLALPTPAPSTAVTQARGELLGVTQSNKLVSFNRAAPRNLCTRVDITGIQGNVVGIDVRPATSELYALTDASKLYVVDRATGVATEQGTLSTALSGTSFGVGFNPAADRLRIVSDTGQNLRVVPPAAPGAVTANVDAALSTLGTTSVAYTNSFAGTKLTTLFGIDTANDTLVRIGGDPGSAGACTGTPDAGNPNCGVVSNIRSLGVDGDVKNVNGFDIEAATGTAVAAVGIGDATTSTLVSVGLSSDGTTTLMGTIGGGERLVGLSLATDPTVNVTVFASTTSNKLLSFDPKTPASTTALTISGLQTNEDVLGIDFRPQNGLLYAIGSKGRLYTLDRATAAATYVAALSADAGDASSPFTTFNGSTMYGMDFNPMADRLRLIADDEQNLRIVPGTGAVTTDAILTPPGTVVGAAYTNSFAGAPSTKLYAICSGYDQLLLVGNPSPNDGVLTFIGSPLGIDADGDVAFDIAGVPNASFANAFAIAAMKPAGGAATLYNVNLTSGVATPYNATANTIGDGTHVRSVAIQLK